MSSDSTEQQPFDLLLELGRFGLIHNIQLNDPQAVSQFITAVGEALTKVLKDPSVLYGHRTEAMFEAMLVSLGGCALITSEDNGRIHPRDSYLAPDFRVVLLDGTQWLIEVKNAYIQDPSHQQRLFMKQAYRKKLERFAAATGGQLKLAVYWARWHIWTLVTPEDFVDEDGNLNLDMTTGLLHNEMGCLGDRLIGTVPPLTLRLDAVPDLMEPLATDGTVTFTVSDVRIYSGEVQLLEPTDVEIAWMLMRYGRWNATTPQPVLKNGQFGRG